MLEVNGQHAHRIARAHGSFASKLAAALEADKRSDEIMAKVQQVERSSRDQRQRVNRLDGKFAWVNTLGALLRDQAALDADLAAWSRARSADPDVVVTLHPDAASDNCDADVGQMQISLHKILSESSEAAAIEQQVAFRERVRGIRNDAHAILAPLIAAKSTALPDAYHQSALLQQRRRALEFQSTIARLAEECWEMSEALKLEEAAAGVEVSASQAPVLASLASNAPASQPAGHASPSATSFAAAIDDLAHSAGCTDAALRLELLDTALRLQRRCDSELDALDAAWAQQCRGWGVADPHDDRGGWTEDAHRAYTHAVALHAHSRRGEGAAAATASTSTLQTALGLINAAGASNDIITLDQLQRHHAWFCARKHSINRRAARQAQAARERDEFIASAKVKLEAAASSARDAAARAAAAEEQERRSHALHQRLERERAAAQLAAAVEEQIEAELAAAEAAEAGARVAAARERALAQKAALAVYRREAARIAAGRERIAAAQAALAAEAAEEAREYNAERVSFRKKRFEERRIQSAALVAETAALNAQHDEMLARLAANVPYRDRLEEIAAFSDPVRVSAHTAASRAAADMSQAYAAFLQFAQAQAQVHPDAAGGPRPPQLPPRPPAPPGPGAGEGASGGGARAGSSAAASAAAPLLGSARSSSAASGSVRSGSASRRRLVDPSSLAVVAGAAGGGGGGGAAATSHGTVDLLAAAMAMRRGGAGGAAAVPVPPTSFSAAGIGGGGSTSARLSARNSEAVAPPLGPGEGGSGAARGVGGAGWPAALLRLAEDRTREQGLFGRAGFSDAQVTADPRFRLNAALRAGGLGGNAYARQMMAQAGEGMRGAVAFQRQQGSFSFEQ